VGKGKTQNLQTGAPLVEKKGYFLISEGTERAAGKGKKKGGNLKKG